jgi:hypothetical protein
MQHVRRRWPPGQELEFYGRVELRTEGQHWWWYGTWYSRVRPLGVRAGLPYDTPNLEVIGGAEFELARQHAWSLGRPQEISDREARRLTRRDPAASLH